MGIMSNELEINVTSYQVVDDILAAIENSKPLSVLRMGDGEMVCYHYQTSEKPKLNRFLRDMRIEQIDESLESLKLELEKSVINSDFLGLPTSKHLEHSSNWSDIVDTYQSIFQSYTIDSKSKKYCSINVHLEILNNKSIYRVLESIDNLVVISSRDLKSRFIDRFPNIKNLEYHLIPGELAYEEVKSEELLFPEKINELVKTIHSVDRKGSLLIFGGGVSGKILGSEFKNAGGVSLDLGSVFDTWAGKLTRGAGKGAFSYTESTKL